MIDQMTNNELQTLIKNACKAAGWRIKRIADDCSGAIVWIDDAPQIARLADDDGDSRLLQVACKIALHFEKVGMEWCAEAYSQENDDGIQFCELQPLGTDANKAARMAVLRCAAMIGEAME